MTATDFRTSMCETWTALFPNIPAPADGQWALWLLLHDPGVVRQGIAQLATKYCKVGGMDADYMVKFASSVMNRIAKEARDRRTTT